MMHVTWLLIVLALFVLGYSSVSANRLSMTPDLVSPVEVEVHVRLEPTQNIRGFEFRVAYDPALLNLTNISCGDFYDHNWTFFHPGSSPIGGDTGMIYGLILGKGNISTPVDLAVIRFHVLAMTDSFLNFSDIGICNSTQYVDFTFVNGTIHFPSYTIIQSGWSSFIEYTPVWMTVYKGWGSFGNASLSPDKPPSGSKLSPKTRAPINDPLASFIGTVFAAILVTGLLLSLIFSFRRRR